MAQVTQLHRTDPKGCHHGPPGPQNSSTGSSHCRPTAARQPLNPALPGTPLPLQARPRRASAGPHGLRMQSRLGSPEPQSESPGSQTQQEPGWSSEPHKARAGSEFCGEMGKGEKASLPNGQKDLERWPKEQHPRHTGWWGGCCVPGSGGRPHLQQDHTARSRDRPREGLPPQLLPLHGGEVQTRGHGSTDRANAEAPGEAVVCRDVLVQLLHGPPPQARAVVALVQVEECCRGAVSTGWPLGPSLPCPPPDPPQPLDALPRPCP